VYEYLIEKVVDVVFKAAKCSKKQINKAFATSTKQKKRKKNNVKEGRKVVVVVKAARKFSVVLLVFGREKEK
jgi:tRNA C32,U32 (ribose-2'-O)-methylase TrmJ